MSSEKASLHPRNKHRERYNFPQLISICPELKPFVSINEHSDESIDFSNPEAVKMLNKALLKHFYGISNWDIPQGYLCPAIPGRADYLHYVADLLATSNNRNIPVGKSIKVLDIGIGANAVYPIIGNAEYGWHFVGADVDPVAIKIARLISESNPALNRAIECRLQINSFDIFEGIIKPTDYFDLTVCNPPFHSSQEEAAEAATKKSHNLSAKRVTQPILNFGGQNNELWCPGGEEAFLRKMIKQSEAFSKQCFWFTSLVSKKTTLEGVYKNLQKLGVFDVKTIPMSQGQKISRIVCWTFLNEEEQRKWWENGDESEGLS